MIRNLRRLGLTEALSFLLLAGIAMSLKYLAPKPEAVKIVGTAHGALWVFYIGMLGVAFLTKKLPFGPLLFEHKCKALEPTA